MDQLYRVFKINKLSHAPTPVEIKAFNSGLPDILKIILLSPESEYSSGLAIRILSHFTEEEILESYEKLAKDGYTTRTRTLGVARGYQLASKFQQYFRDLFPTRIFDETSVFEKLIRSQLPRQPPLDQVEDDDYTNFLHILPMCSAGAVAQGLSNLVDGKIKIIPIVPNINTDDMNDQVHREGRGGVQHHLLFPTQGDAQPQQGPRKRNRYYGISNESSLLFAEMIVEQGYESQLMSRSAISDISTGNSGESSSSSKKRKEFPETEGHNGALKRRKTDITELCALLLPHVEKAGAHGITITELTKKHPEHVEDLTCALQSLRDEGRVLEVDDQTQRRYVMPTHVARWCIAGETPEVVRPWITLAGTVNNEVWDSLRKRLLYAITRNPGIRESKLMEELPILSPVAVQDLLKSLEKEDKIYHTAHTMEAPSLFSTFEMPWSSKSHKTDEQSYFATRRCLLLGY